MPTPEQKIDQLRFAIAAKRAEAQEKHDKATSAELRAITEDVKDLSKQLSAAITEGAEPCEGCGELPLGMVQQIAVKNEALDYFEIGCSKVCRHKRAQGFSRAQAVQKWNDAKYLPPTNREDALTNNVTELDAQGTKLSS